MPQNTAIPLIFGLCFLTWKCGFTWFGRQMAAVSRYMARWIERYPKSRFRHWPKNGIITVPQLKTFIGMILNMGLNPRKRQARYWDSSRSQHFPFFGSVMSQHTVFFLISRIFHANTAYQVPRGEEGLTYFVVACIL